MSWISWQVEWKEEDDVLELEGPLHWHCSLLLSLSLNVRTVVLF